MAALARMIAIALVAVPAAAHADSDPPLVSARAIEITSAFEIDLSRASPYAPLWVPGARYGVTPRLTVGATATVPFTGQDSPLCGACDHPRGGAFADAAHGVVQSDLARIAARVRLGSASVDRFHAAATLGAIGRFGTSRWWIDGDPHLSFGLSGRDDGNDDFVDLPVWLCAQPASFARVYLHTGYRAPLTGLADAFYVPIGLGVVALPVDGWEVGVEGLFPRVAGPLNSGRIRTAFAFVRARR